MRDVTAAGGTLLSRNRSFALKILAAVLVVTAAAWAILQLPVDVPDTNSPLEGNHTGEVNAANTIGQTLVASRNGLDRIEVTLAVEHPLDNANLVFHVQEMPWKESREVTRGIVSLPVGKAGEFAPGTITQRWYSFEFDPIPDSAGKQFYFTIEGKTLDGPHSAGLLMFFHNGYPQGEAYINGNPVGAHVVFKAYSRGKVADLIQALLENTTENQPGLAASPNLYLAIALAYAVIGSACVLAIKRAG